jgi:hypothetical protein
VRYFEDNQESLLLYLSNRLKMMSILSLRDIIVFFVAVRGVEGAYNLGSQMPSKFAGGNLASEIKLEHYFFFKLAILGFFLFCKSLILSLEISSISLLKC